MPAREWVILIGPVGTARPTKVDRRTLVLDDRNPCLSPEIAVARYGALLEGRGLVPAMSTKPGWVRLGEQWACYFNVKDKMAIAIAAVERPKERSGD